MNAITQHAASKWAFITNSLIAVLMAGSLFGCGNWFIHEEYTALFVYEFIAALLILLRFIKLLLSRKEILYPTAIQSAIIVYGVFTFIHGLWIAKNFNPYHVYILISCLLAISLSDLIEEHFQHHTFKIIVIIAFIEAWVCILQSLKILEPFSQYFDVTGTVGNPNVTAMFLSMAVCLLPQVHQSAQRSLFKKILILVSLAIIIALYLLKCRTAFVGLTVAVLIRLYHSRLFYVFWQKCKKTERILIAIIIGLLMLTAAIRMYQAKKASADGRRLIWKISMMMIKDRPFFGSGFGDFEKHYNQYQAGYFSKSMGSLREKQQADHINMAYNEVLENGVNGGVISILLLFSILFFTVVRPHIWRNREDECSKGNEAYWVAYSGLACLYAMSLFNFTLQAIPVMTMAVFYLAILRKKHRIKKISVLDRRIQLFIPIAILTAGAAWLCLDVFYTAQASMKAKLLFEQGDQDKSKWNQLTSKLRGYPSFWISYGDILYRNGEYTEALMKYSEAKKISSEKHLYLQMALCYEHTGNNGAAIAYYRYLSTVQPYSLLPKYRLLKIYQKQARHAMIIEQATDMLAFVPKIRSAKSLYFQNYAKTVLASYKASSLKPINTFRILKLQNR